MKKLFFGVLLSLSLNAFAITVPPMSTPEYDACFESTLRAIYDISSVETKKVYENAKEKGDKEKENKEFQRLQLILESTSNLANSACLPLNYRLLKK